ncbi:MAG: carbohydrate ABC transporter substrate-binding protein [Lachnospiraceae bacterium]|nr:carbohydrate ABC transporter substrate-binding protein [Lachnospiraceae bacterium]
MRKKNSYIVHIFIIIMVSFYMTGCGCKDRVPASSDESININQAYHAEDGDFLDAAQIGNVIQEEGRHQAERIHITLYNGGFTDTGIMSYLVNAFNRDNETYQVDMKRFSNSELQVIQDRITVELATGDGPDIMTLDIIPEAPVLIKKGYFVELSKLMELSDMKEEMFFPAYKSLVDGNAVYGLCPSVDVVGMMVHKDVIGEEGIPDFESFVDLVLNYPKDAIFENSIQDGTAIMNYFLCGSDDLWGMIDWESKKCDFQGELFSKILDVAKRYGDAAKKGYDPIMRPRYMYAGIYAGEKQYEKEGWVTIDYYFDDGNYPLYNWSLNTLMINANTKQLEGAWAFLSYAMTKTGQSFCVNPVQKEVFDLTNEELLKAIEEGRAQMSVEMTEESVAEMKRVFETGRYSPIRPREVLKIVEEEAAAYFSGDKTRQDVIDVIQKRVQLFLAEN